MAERVAVVSSGATFFRGDLHIHSFGASHDCSDASATPEAIVKAAKREGIALIALADHNEISNVRPAVAAGEAEGVLVVPGVELSTAEGHLLCYAPTPDALERFFNRLDIADRGTNACRCQTGSLQCLKEIEQVGGFGILAHVDLQGAFESNMQRFTPAKIDILAHSALAGIEVAHANSDILYTDEDVSRDRRNAAQVRSQRLQRGSKHFLARIQNSDAHTLNAVGRNAENDRRITRYKMESPSFEGLRLALRSADTRVRIEEGLPVNVPIVEGIEFQGGFLAGEKIKLSPNLTCIIGGRGSGKSTAFEAICLLSGRPDPTVDVIDSDVWPDILSISYRDETGHSHLLARSKGGPMANLDDPVIGSTSFPIESYRQGATNEISKRVQSDPLALLTFLDRLVVVEGAIAIEDKVRQQLNELTPDIAKAAAIVAKISGYEQALKLKSDQLQRLKDDNAEEVIALQQQLESERNARANIEAALVELGSAISSQAITDITAGIRSSAEDSLIAVGVSEASQIASETAAFEATVTGSAKALKASTTSYVAAIRTQILSWKTKESATTASIEAKKQDLLNHGIRLDMPFIQKTVSDEAQARENLRVAKTWVAELARLRQAYANLLTLRTSARSRVSTIRTAFATRASMALRNTMTDLSVSLKFEPDALCPEGERLISDAMQWKTLAQLKSKALMGVLTLPVLLDCIRRKNPKPIQELKNEFGSAMFSATEASSLLDRLSEADLLAQLESVAVHDKPRLGVTKRIEGPDGTATFAPRDFAKLSLGQQQSVLLALMLTSESTAPLIVDQPEDNLDSEFIYKTLVPVIRSVKERRQVIVVTHNANIAVLGDSELIIALKATHSKGSVMSAGSIDHKETCDLACDILEGSREAFDRRREVYGIALKG